MKYITLANLAQITTPVPILYFTHSNDDNYSALANQQALVASSNMQMQVLLHKPAFLQALADDVPINEIAKHWHLKIVKVIQAIDKDFTTVYQKNNQYQYMLNLWLTHFRVTNLANHPYYAYSINLVDWQAISAQQTFTEQTFVPQLADYHLLPLGKIIKNLTMDEILLVNHKKVASDWLYNGKLAHFTPFSMFNQQCYLKIAPHHQDLTLQCLIPNQPSLVQITHNTNCLTYANAWYSHTILTNPNNACTIVYQRSTTGLIRPLMKHWLNAELPVSHFIKLQNVLSSNLYSNQMIQQLNANPFRLLMITSVLQAFNLPINSHDFNDFQYSLNFHLHNSKTHDYWQIAPVITGSLAHPLIIQKLHKTFAQCLTVHYQNDKASYQIQLATVKINHPQQYLFFSSHVQADNLAILDLKKLLQAYPSLRTIFMQIKAYYELIMSTVQHDSFLSSNILYHSNLK